MSNIRGCCFDSPSKSSGQRCYTLLTLPRLVSHTPSSLGTHVMAILETRQQNLEELCTPIGTEDNIIHNRQTVNEFVPNDTTSAKLSNHLLLNAPNMKRLLLEGDVDASLHWSDLMYDNVGPKLPASIQQLESLQELVIRNRPLDRQLYVDWGNIIDFSALRRLILWHCYSDETDTGLGTIGGFLAALGSRSQGRVLHLQHFAVDIDYRGSHSPYSTFKLYSSVAKVLRRCIKLQSLHLNWFGLLATKDPSETENFGKPLELPTLEVGKSVEILSFHDCHSNKPGGLESWLRQFPHLTQLALQISE
jgi:hypothetical protein